MQFFIACLTIPVTSRKNITLKTLKRRNWHLVQEQTMQEISAFPILESIFNFPENSFILQHPPPLRIVKSKSFSRFLENQVLVSCLPPLFFFNIKFVDTNSYLSLLNYYHDFSR